MKLASSHIFCLLYTIAWGVGAIPLNVQAKLECNEDLALMIQAIQAKYANALRGAWMERNWKSASNKIV
jgi:hypothetical protein